MIKILKMKFFKITLLILLFIKYSEGYPQGAKIEDDILKIAEEWTNAWNGKIDKDRMMRLYDNDLLYYWRGSADTYEEFENVLVNFIIPTSDGSTVLEMINPTIVFQNKGSAIVSFNIRDEGSSDELGGAAFSLGLKETLGEWKIVHVHESPVRPLPPYDFEEQFNKVSKKYQDDYMNARCDAILPILDEHLVIYENGEQWPYEKVKAYCPKLPVKPVISTERNYNILDETKVYEFVSQQYEINSKEPINETVARIWKFSNGEWKIVQMDISRNWIKER